jgi:hypothetical protein
MMNYWEPYEIDHKRKKKGKGSWDLAHFENLHLELIRLL